jgi:hypothetical protein
MDVYEYEKRAEGLESGPKDHGLNVRKEQCAIRGIRGGRGARIRG